MIDVVNVSKTYGEVQAVADASFHAPAGAVTAFVGRNGAGKSTVLRMIAGLTRPDRGHVLVDGAPFERSEHPGRTLGTHLDATALPPRLTAASFLAWVCDTQGASRSRVVPALEAVGLREAGARRIGGFSLGMRQRLGIAQACILEPQVMVFDEPVNGLDPDGIHWFRSFIAEQARNGKTVLLSSHNMAELAMSADRVVVIDRGRILADQTLEELLRTRTGETVYIESPDVHAVIGLFTQRGWTASPHDQGAIVTGATTLEVGRAAFADGVGLTHLSRTTASLEETFFTLVQDGEGRR